MYQLNGVCMIWHTTKSNILLRHQGLIKISYDIHSRKVINDNNVNLFKSTFFFRYSDYSILQQLLEIFCIKKIAVRK